MKLVYIDGNLFSLLRDDNTVIKTWHIDDGNIPEDFADTLQQEGVDIVEVAETDLPNELVEKILVEFWGPEE